MDLCFDSLNLLEQYVIPQDIAEMNATINDLKDLRGGHDYHNPI